MREKCVAVSKAGRSWGSRVCPAGVWSCFGPAFPNVPPFASFGNDYIYSVPLNIEGTYLNVCFYKRVTVKRLP